jgi:hypothetical protein
VGAQKPWNTPTQKTHQKIFLLWCCGAAEEMFGDGAQERNHVTRGAVTRPCRSRRSRRPPTQKTQKNTPKNCVLAFWSSQQNRNGPNVSQPCQARYRVTALSQPPVSNTAQTTNPKTHQKICGAVEQPGKCLLMAHSATMSGEVL